MAIRHKRKNSAGYVWQTADLVDGQLGCNPVDGTLHLKNNAGTAIYTFKSSYSKADVGLGNVENTALSDWAGSTALMTLGTVTSGTWSADTIALNKGGTGATTQAGAANAILPAQSGHSGHVLTTDGGNVAWNAIANPNTLINGRFDVWQRGISLSAGTGGRYCADRWLNASVGSTIAPSQQAFALGQTSVPGNPAYFHRCVVASVASAGNYALLSQRIEDVGFLSGEPVTLSFWAKVSSGTKNIAVEWAQYFGTGGSPSATVTAIGVNTLTLTTSWQLFTVTVTLPSVSGKTVGSNGDHSTHLNFWMDGGSNFNSRTNSLGQQSATFDFANIKLEKGSLATPLLIDPQTELLRCYRYYQEKNVLMGAIATLINQVHYNTVPHLAPMRAIPTDTYSSTTDVNCTSVAYSVNAKASFFQQTSSGSGAFRTNVTIASVSEL